jgi:hypothetical protein
MLDLHRHYGPLHKHATTGVPREPGLEEVHGKGQIIEYQIPSICGLIAVIHSCLQRCFTPT